MSNDLVAMENNGNNLTFSDSGDERQMLTFALGDEIYGIDILKVQEIRGWTQVTQIPNAPPFIRGVMNLRGAIVPVLDMRRRFEMEEIDFTQYTVVIVVQVEGRTVGMIVDAVSDVVTVPADELRAAPNFGTSIDASFLEGLIPQNDRMIIMLDVNALLAGSDMMEIDRVTQDAQTHAE